MPEQVAPGFESVPTGTALIRPLVRMNALVHFEVVFPRACIVTVAALMQRGGIVFTLVLSLGTRLAAQVSHEMGLMTESKVAVGTRVPRICVCRFVYFHL